MDVRGHRRGTQWRARPRAACPNLHHHAVPTANIIRVRVRTNLVADATRVWQAEARQAILPLDEDPLQTDLVWVCRAAPVEIGAFGREPRPASADQRSAADRTKKAFLQLP